MNNPYYMKFSIGQMIQIDKELYIITNIEPGHTYNNDKPRDKRIRKTSFITLYEIAQGTYARYELEGLQRYYKQREKRIITI